MLTLFFVFCCCLFVCLFFLFFFWGGGSKGFLVKDQTFYGFLSLFPPLITPLSEDVSGLDFEIKCLSCRKDEPDSGKLTTHFFNSTQSHTQGGSQSHQQHKVNIMLVRFPNPLAFATFKSCVLFLKK